MCRRTGLLLLCLSIRFFFLCEFAREFAARVHEELYPSLLDYVQYE